MSMARNRRLSSGLRSLPARFDDSLLRASCQGCGRHGQSRLQDWSGGLQSSSEMAMDVRAT